jgi:hypothetical protein
MGRVIRNSSWRYLLLTPATAGADADVSDSLFGREDARS